jgi:HEAT repeat protein
LTATEHESPEARARGEAEVEAAFAAMKAQAEAPRQGTPFLVLQFFVFPMSIVAVCVLVFVVFGLIAAEGKGARAYLDEVRTGSANRRWQAAFELSKVLQAGKDPALREAAFVDELVRTFQDSTRDDPRVRRYLALALGRLGDRRAVPALREAARGGEGADAEAQVYAVWALGALADAAAVPDLLALARGGDPGLRKAAVHALGAFSDAQSAEALAAAAGDEVTDVRWNAGLALGRRGDPRATPVLAQMLDRARLAGVAGISAEQQEAALLEACRVAASLPGDSLRPALESLRAADPSPRGRAAARAALEPAAR